MKDVKTSICSCLESIAWKVLQKQCLLREISHFISSTLPGNSLIISPLFALCVHIHRDRWTLSLSWCLYPYSSGHSITLSYPFLFQQCKHLLTIGCVPFSSTLFREVLRIHQTFTHFSLDLEAQIKTKMGRKNIAFCFSTKLKPNYLL